MSLNYKIFLFTAIGSMLSFGVGYHVGSVRLETTQKYKKLKLEFRKLSARYEDAQKRSKRLAKAYKAVLAGVGKSEKAVAAAKHKVSAGTGKASVSANYSEVAKDGTFTAYDNGVVYDSRTGLEWLLGPDKDTDWYQAKSWIKNIADSEGKWRMPTVTELQSLYRERSGARNISQLLKTNGWYAWSGTEKDASSAWGFGFYLGADYIDLRNVSLFSRAFAVRSRKKWWNVF